MNTTLALIILGILLGASPLPSIYFLSEGPWDFLSRLIICIITGVLFIGGVLTSIVLISKSSNLFFAITEVALPSIAAFCLTWFILYLKAKNNPPTTGNRLIG